MIKFTFFSFPLFLTFILFSIKSFSQNTPVYIPENLSQTSLIVEKLDSIGPRCRIGKKPVYCNEQEKELDKQLRPLQRLQEHAFFKYKFPHVLVLAEAFPYQEFTDLKDTDKYRYILKIHRMDPSEDEEDIKWVYYFYDRKTGKNFPRITQIQDYKFKSLKNLVTKLNEAGGEK